MAVIKKLRLEQYVGRRGALLRTGRLRLQLASSVNGISVRFMANSGDPSQPLDIANASVDNSSAHMTIALTSDFPSTINAAVVELIKAPSRQPHVAWVAPHTVAVQEKLPAAKKAFRSLGVRHVDSYALDGLRSILPISLDSYDVVYLTGGDPIDFREGMRRTHFYDQLRSFLAAGGIVVGASGGAMQVTRNVSLFRLLSLSVDEVVSDRERFDALGAIDIELLPHLNRHSVDFLEKVLRYSERVAQEILALSDGAAVIFRDGESTATGNATTFRQGTQVPFLQ